MNDLGLRLDKSDQMVFFRIGKEPEDGARTGCDRSCQAGRRAVMKNFAVLEAEEKVAGKRHLTNGSDRRVPEPSERFEVRDGAFWLTSALEREQSVARNGCGPRGIRREKDVRC